MGIEEVLRDAAPDGADASFEQYRDGQLISWDDGEVERNVHVSSVIDGQRTVEFSVWHDDTEEMERYWYHETVAKVAPEYENVLRSAVDAAASAVVEVKRDQLEYVDGLAET